MFRDFVKEHNPKDMLDVDEFLAMRKEVLAELSKDGEKKASVEKQDLSLSDITMTIRFWDINPMRLIIYHSTGEEGGGGRVCCPWRGGRGRQREAGHRRGELRHEGEDDLQQEEGK